VVALVIGERRPQRMGFRLPLPMVGRQVEKREQQQAERKGLGSRVVVAGEVKMAVDVAALGGVQRRQGETHSLVGLAGLEGDVGGLEDVVRMMERKEMANLGALGEEVGVAGEMETTEMEVASGLGIVVEGAEVGALEGVGIVRRVRSHWVALEVVQGTVREMRKGLVGVALVEEVVVVIVMVMETERRVEVAFARVRMVKVSCGGGKGNQGRGEVSVWGKE